MAEQKLLIIMRKDLFDMNPGKGMAQACHAQADFTHTITGNESLLTDWTTESMSVDSQFYKSEYAAWSAQAGTFGTTVVKHATLDDINTLRSRLVGEFVPNGLVVDPTYPYKNYYGDWFTSEEITCSWFFINSATCDALREEISEVGELHP